MVQLEELKAAAERVRADNHALQAQLAARRREQEDERSGESSPQSGRGRSPPSSHGHASRPADWDPEDIVDRLMAALMDHESRSRQWHDERQEMQASWQHAVC